MVGLRLCSPFVGFLASILLVSCGTMEKLPLVGDDEPESLLAKVEPDADNSLRLTVEPGTQTKLWFYFSALAPEGSRIRVKISEPAGWLPTSKEKMLAEVETTLDGSFPKAASFPVDEKLEVRLRAEFQDPEGRWQSMSLIHPSGETKPEDLMEPGARESAMIRWAVHGDPMNGTLGVKLRIDE